MLKKESIWKYIKLLTLISLPIIVQNLFTNLASLLDTLMVGQIDETNISGVYIATEIIFVINLALFGSVEGGSVFFSQFLGNKDTKHLKNTFNFKIILSFIVSLIAIFVVLLFGKQLCYLFSKDEEVISIALDYLHILTFSFIPVGIATAISSSMRESHSTLPPMIITMCGIILNCILNYIFIFGKLGAPALGGVGAAIGTLSERIFELIALFIAMKVKKYDFSKGFFRNFKFEKSLYKSLIMKSLPLLGNELLWALGQITLVYVFTKKSTIAVTVLPIVSTIYNLIFVVLLGLGNGITILVGNIIGHGDLKDAQNKAYVSILYTLSIACVLCLLLVLFAPVIVSLYSGIGEEAKNTAIALLRFQGLILIINSMNTCLFFLIRSGGRTFVVFLFDSVFAWCISIPLATLFLHISQLSFVQLYYCIYLCDLIKTVIGLILIFSKKWYKNIAKKYEEKEVTSAEL